MGLLDGSLYGGGLLDPNTASMLGFAAGIGQASGPSRLPISTGQVMGSGIQGMLSGQRHALTSSLLNQEIEKNALANQFALWRMGLVNSILSGQGGAPGAPGGGTLAGGSPMSGGTTPPPSVGNGTAAVPSSSTLQAATVNDVLFPGAGKDIISKQYPGPTDLQRALAFLQTLGPDDPRRPLAVMAARKAAGAEFANLRQGGALVDPISGQFIAQNPVLGEGVHMDPSTGQAVTVPNYVNAAQPVRTMEAATRAQFEPLTTYDQFGNEVIRPRTSLAAGAAGNVTSGLPAGTTAAQVTQPVPLAFKTAANGQPQPTTLDKLQLTDLVPSAAAIPQRPAAPAGGFYGKPNEGTGENQKLDAERLGGYQKQASEGQKIHQDLQMLDGVLQRGLNTNKLAPLWTDLTNVLQGMGLSSIIPKNYDPNDSAVFDKVATDAVFAALKQLPGQPRVAEIEGLQRANPNMTLPRAANAEIMHAILANQMWMDKRSDLATQFSAKYPGAPLGFFDAQFNKAAPLTDVTKEVFDTARKQGWQFPGDPGTPSGPPAPAPFAGDTRAQTIKQNYLKGMYGKVGSPEARAAAEKAYNAQ